MRKVLNTIAASLAFTGAALVFGLSQSPASTNSVSAQVLTPTVYFTPVPTGEGGIGGIIVGGGTPANGATATAQAVISATARAGATATAFASGGTATAQVIATSTAAVQQTSTAIAQATSTAIAGATATLIRHGHSTANATATAAPGATATSRAQATGTAIAGATATSAVYATGTASANATATAAPGATATSRAQATGTAVAGATATARVQATGTASANATATAAPGATSTAIVRATGTAVAGATATARVQATGTASANATATAAPGATATAGVRATGTAAARATATRSAQVTATARANATATAAPGATATARVQATGTAIAGATSTAVVRATGTASANATATAAPGATATARVQATGTAVAGATSTAIIQATGTASANATATAAPGATSTAIVRATGTAVAGATATEVVRATGTAQANATGTAVVQATETAIVQATGTASAYATATARATSNATPIATSAVDLNKYEYTCRVGTAVDSTTGENCTSFYGETYEFRTGQWWTTKTYCMTAAQCETPEGTPLDQYDQLPCVPRLTASGIVVDCKPNADLQTWNVTASVYTECPINEVLRSPYPRTLVNLKTNFILQPKEYNDVNGISSAPQAPANIADFLDADGNPTEDGFRVGVWKNLRLVMRSHRFNGGETWFGDVVPQPRWVFTDRAWNSGVFPAIQDGPIAKYQYETSSADLGTRFGRGFDIRNKIPANTFDLPAYPVQLTSYCGHEWKVVVELAKKEWEKTGACYGTILYPDGSTYVPPGTDRADCPPGEVAPGRWKYGWTSFETTEPGPNGEPIWPGIDLKLIGRPVSYDQRMRTKGGGVFRTLGVPRVYWDDPWGLWIPVVEVQSVIRDECVADGSCEPIGAEAGSLAP